MHSNATASVSSYEAVLEPTIAIIGLILGIIGLLQSSLFTYSAVVGLGKPDGWLPPPKEWGRPWQFSIATGLEGPKANATEPLAGPGGPSPDIHLFNDNGEYLGTTKDRNTYIQHNKAIAENVYPINVYEHEGQYATFVILEGKGDGRDPLCVVDFGLGRPNGLEIEGSTAFGAYTAVSCGAPWYYSGVYRQDANGTVPCFWLGGYGVQGMQVHLPSHTRGQTNIPIDDINRDAETAHDFFCNRPAVLHLWAELPDRHLIPTILMTDLNRRGGRSLNDTLEMRSRKNLLRPGRPSLAPRSVQLPVHEDTVTVAHELGPGLSASQLCADGLSMGPDYVNIPEGKFCRMSDKTLWPTCGGGDGSSKSRSRDDCFDVDSRQLIVGGKVTRSEPYSKEINYPLK